jgi:sugar phosphate isomerase/epimerase
MTNHTLSRRDLLKAGAAGTLALGLPGLAVAKGKGAPKAGLALQLYSVRNDCKDDFDAALARVAKMGFDAVEFAGYHNYQNDPKGLRKKLDDLGLEAAATHIGTGTLVGDNLAKTIDFHKAIGCKYLCVPGDKRFSQPDGSKELAEIFNKVAEELKKVDMYTGYHNHTHEFKTEGDKTYWELFAERTSEDVVLQQDVGWTTVAGYDPAEMIRKYPGRSQVIHCKPSMVKGDEGRSILGEDSVKWVPVFEACRDVGGTEWLTLEQEAYPDGKSPMECVELSLAGMKKILGAM